jgi:hypothetical protein
MLVNLLCVQSFAHSLDPSYCLLDASEPLLRAHSVLGTRALRILSSAAAPAVAAYRTAHELMTWRVPHALYGTA